VSEPKPPDILVFMSDQHHALYAGFAGHPIVETPNLDALAADGTVFDAAYTACPLCVPSRSALLTGQLPSKTGIFTNSGAIREDQATYAHCLGAAGYDVVLCGRMHFMGPDQRHGFTKRLVGDYTPLLWGRYGLKREDLGPFVQTSSSKFAKIVGGGTSPVLEYDRAVVAAALEYLEQDHARPQCLVVGTYAPHHTFVAPPELYRHYRDIATLPESFKRKPDYAHPVMELRRRDDWDEETILRIRAAYFGMITNLDAQLGAVREAWKRFTDRRGTRDVFLYLSDHGEHAAEHNMQGKGTFFECSGRIPLVVAGEGLRSDARVTEPVSILDIGPTLCELAGTDGLPDPDGVSLASVLTGGSEDAGRHVLSEFILPGVQGEAVPGRMIRRGKWKYITYAGYEEHDLLFDVEADPFELHNAARGNAKVVEELRAIACRDWDSPGIRRKHEEQAAHFKTLRRWGDAVDVDEPERWCVPSRFRKPSPPVSPD